MNAAYDKLGKMHARDKGRELYSKGMQVSLGGYLPLVL